MDFEYKVAQLSNSSLWTGTIDPGEVEKLINGIAVLGWEFVSLTSQRTGARNTIMAVFKRAKNAGS